MPRCGGRGLKKIGGETLGEGDRFFFSRQKSRGGKNWRTQIPQNISKHLWGVNSGSSSCKEKSIEKCLDFEWIFLIGKMWDAGIPGFCSISGLLGDSMFLIYTTEN